MLRLLPLLLLVACADDVPTPAPRSYTRAEAEKLAFEASGELMGTLLTELTNAVNENRGENLPRAFAICADVAQEITERIRTERGVSMRRTALRVRNRANAPDPFEQSYMEAVVKSGEVPTTPHVEVVDGELRYLRPIGVAPLCTQCHGARDELGPALRRALDERYPDDAATGYAPGDFRGVVSVRIPVRD